MCVCMSMSQFLFHWILQTVHEFVHIINYSIVVNVQTHNLQIIQ